MEPLILGIETSCDDSSVAVVKADGEVLFCTSQNQDEYHKAYGGVVPEIASRNHSEHLLPMIELALKKQGIKFTDLSAIAVTTRPGLVGSLMVGLVTAKSLALVHGLPWVSVNHIHAHVLSAFLKDKPSNKPNGPKFPFVSLVVSGGHTHLFLVKSFTDVSLIGRTADDAAGEALDKFAKLVGLGFPGGAKVDLCAKTGDPKKYEFARPMLNSKNLSMSFSGLKTFALNMLTPMNPQEIQNKLPDLCASYQEAVVDVLIEKLGLAAEQYKVKDVSIVGGVSANSRLRERAAQFFGGKKIGLHIPQIQYSTDNAAMIAFAGHCVMANGVSPAWDEGPSPMSLNQDFS